MNSDAEARWAMAVRLLALISAVLVVLTVLEARTIRELRSELQAMRVERGQVAAGQTSPPRPCTP
jgi:hypothetical protein